MFYKLRTYAVAGIKYSICLELRPGQTGTDATYGK